MGDGEVIGRLTDWIQTSNELTELDMLRDDVDTMSFSRREKWAGQIKQAIERLHSQGVIRGNANPRNLMIDGENDVLLADLAGGFNFDGELMDRMEDDLEELREFCMFLKVYADHYSKLYGDLFISDRAR
jgi:tRNA A-37 threonylcarbamoyl transferase component Bud32